MLEYELETKLNNGTNVKGWYNYNDSDSVIVFVHGLFSNSDKCWTSKNGVFWPKLVLEDKRINNPSIFLAEFYTSSHSNDYGLKDCANEVYQSLLRKDQDNNSPPIHKKNIIFITHSTGGIVTRYLLDVNREAFISKRIGICLYTSPSYGSRVSTFFGSIAKLFNHKLAQELSWGSHILKDLDDRFIKLVHAKKIDISGMEAYENKAPFVPFTRVRVVEELSAARYFGNIKLIPNTDHSSIVKPISLDEPSHQYFYDFLEDNKLIEQLECKPVSKLPSLFDRYKREYEDYFIERISDKELEQILSQYSIWVWGSPGLGKTVSITRALNQQKQDYKYISLGSCIGGPVIELFKEIFLEVVDSHVDLINGKTISEYIKPLSDLIAVKCHESDFCLFIEEIPIDNAEDFIEFSNYVYYLLTSISDVSNFKLILSSIYCPNIDLKNEMQKISERLKILEWGLWLDEDIEKLITLISKDTKIILNDDFMVNGFENNPRNVKNYYRDKLVTNLNGSY